ncbi:single-strand DNA-binding protein B [Streptococcus pneumoniae]|nr:single-strand DNA-binding protein B [Streptococcus pneumoniae]
MTTIQPGIVETDFSTVRFHGDKERAASVYQGIEALQMNYVTEVLVTGFQLLESRAQRAMRENNAGQDLADLVLEEEELPF